jgi:hypothetical protein
MAAGAPREGGGINPAAEAKAITELFRKASLVDVKRIMGGKKSELEAAYGKKVPTPEEQSFFGNLHAIIKYLPKKSEIFRSMEKRFKHAIENGEDVNSDVVRMRIVSEAIIDGNRAIFMGDNAVVDAYKAAIRSLERPGKGSKSLVNIMKFLFPIIKVPTNYVAATGQYLIGGLKAMAILSRGYDNLTPAEKDTFMRLMKRQSVGLAFFAIGFLNPGAVGGYYTGKREEDDLHAGEISVFGLHLPHWMTHAPIIEVMQFGSTVRRLHDSYEEQAELSGEPNKRGYLTSALMAGTKLIEQVPFLGVTGDFTEATKSDNKMNTFIGTILRSLAVPPDIQKMAKGQGPLGFVAKEAGLYRGDVDKYGETVKRKAVTLLEQIMLGVPGMRESLPEQDPVGSARDQIRREIKESPEWENARQLAKDNLASAGEEIKKSGLLEKIDMGLLKKAGIWEDKQLERLIIKALINPDVSKFWDMPAEKQIRRWINLTDKEKKEYLPYIHSKETFMNLEKRDADILKEPNAVKAVKEIASMSGW